MTEQIIAQRLGIALRQVQGTVRLLRDGATIPFISRYRKEATGSLDELQRTGKRKPDLKIGKSSSS